MDVQTGGDSGVLRTWAVRFGVCVVSLCHPDSHTSEVTGNPPWLLRELILVTGISRLNKLL